MARLKLKLESLEIDTFDLGASPDTIGTVHAAGIEPMHKDTGNSYNVCDGGGGGGGGSGWIGCISVYPCVPTNEWSCQITCGGYTCDSFSCPKYNTCHYAGCQIA